MSSYLINPIAHHPLDTHHLQQPQQKPLLTLNPPPVNHEFSAYYHNNNNQIHYQSQGQFADVDGDGEDEQDQDPELDLNQEEYDEDDEEDEDQEHDQEEDDVFGENVRPHLDNKQKIPDVAVAAISTPSPLHDPTPNSKALLERDSKIIRAKKELLSSQISSNSVNAEKTPGILKKMEPGDSLTGSPPADDVNSLLLLKENRMLRKKVETLMKHNMQLMVGMKDRDHKIYKQKQLLSKYRKALLRFFEDNESPVSESSSESELSNLDEDNNKFHSISSTTTATIARKSISHQQPPIIPPSPILSPVSSPTPQHTQSAAPSPPQDITPDPIPTPEKHHYTEMDDYSSNNGDGHIYREFFAAGKKRKAESTELNSKPEKRKKGPRRNALWSAEDDELFTKVYNVYGKSWKTIHTFMPDKTREQVQSHGQYLIRIGKLEDIKSTGTRRGRKPKNHESKNQQQHQYQQPQLQTLQQQ
jgi:hypothetical protein